jgi:hypothetical protein
VIQPVAITRNTARRLSKTGNIGTADGAGR